MELRQLRYLVALAEELNFTRAAEREHVAQPALSQQIRRLEDEVGLALVERTTRHVSLTDAGEVLVVRARRVLAELEAAGTELQALRGMDTGHVTIGAMHTMGPVDLSLPLALFHDLHPGVGLTVREQSSEEMAEMLRVDELDLAFLSVTERVESPRAGPAPARLRGAGGPPAARAPAQRPRGRCAWRSWPTSSSSASAPAPGCASCCSPPAARPASSRGSRSSPTRASASAGSSPAGSAWPSCRARTPSGPGAEVAVARLVEPSLRRDITLAWREGRRLAPAAAAFLDLARETFADPDDEDATHRAPVLLSPDGHTMLLLLKV